MSFINNNKIKREKNILATAIILSYLLLVGSSCSKSNSTDNKPSPTKNVTYSFSTPVKVAAQNAADYAYPISDFAAVVTPNHIYQRAVTGVDGGSYDLLGGLQMYYYKDNSTLSIFFPNQIIDDLPQLYLGAGSFCVDKNDKFFYSFIDSISFRAGIPSTLYLYKYDMSSATVSNYTPKAVFTLSSASASWASTHPSAQSCMKLLDNGDILYASDGNGGSILSLKSGSATPTTLAANLGAAPTAIDVYNNETYFTLDLSNGSVQKISSSGNVSTVISNLTNPSRLVFDNNGNMVVETQVTYKGGNYGKYTIYTSNGTRITDISDDQNVLILSATGNEVNMPLFIDNNNNLYFGHSDYLGQGNSTLVDYANPFINGLAEYNIYKIQLTKK